MNLVRLFAVVRKELRQLARDRLTFAMIVGIPTLQLLLFGFAINLDVRHLPAAVLDEANTWRSRELVAELSSSQVLDFRHRVAVPQQVEMLMRRGEISAAVVVPRDFEHRLERGGEPAWQVVVDGSDQSVQAAARQLAAFPLAALDFGGPAARPGTRASGSVEVVNFYNPERRAPVNTVPGLIGVILTMTMVVFTAMAIVRERERGNMEMLIATPLSSAELMLGKVLPYVGIGFVQVSLILLLGLIVFAVPVRGSLVAVYAASLAYIAATLALGMLISTLTRTQFQAMQMAFFLFLPQILLSGFMFPYDGMPRPAQWLAEVFPLTHFLRLIRGVMLRGAGLAELWPSLAALGAFVVIVLSLAVLRFRKRLD
ncbi:MAG TPA: ABC transporter permease [Dokdonella sp.]|uniref:ABC transporter permease n=1 Tax=Dokdonella sp. TaxID=2291710 RepID=UPI0025C59BDA|nr:ABC transporter permease [Dokdonella sp.]MBX3690929.1 ABC transporter permease [Dokdonella sp.]MCW5566806.1 ABC transporter permease [Dokdonella sp.]HNR91081.1 ABC transporter permease [Dokdonella sp.]